MRYLLSRHTPWRGLAVALLALLAACSKSSSPGVSTEAGGAWMASVQSLIPGAIGGPGPRYRALAAAGAPVQLLFSEETGGFDQMRLERRTPAGDETWLASQGMTVSMRDGMLLATRGLGRDVLAADGRETRRLLAARQEGQAKHFMAFLNGENEVEREAFVCDIRREDDQTIDLLTREQRMQVMSESCMGSSYGFYNLYWIDPADGRIWQSRQFVSSTAGMMAFRLFTPEAVTAIPADTWEGEQ